ncbi:MAG: PQQ-dependent sugar dehydrogenase [Bacteriovorax sp.]|jgi:glucose/arabinose dehydrogenase
MKYILLLFPLLLSCQQLSPSISKRNPSDLGSASNAPFKTSEVWTEEESVWGFDFITEHELIITLRSGQIKLINLQNKTSVSIKNLPPVDYTGQGGMLDIMLDREFPKNHLVFWSFSKKMGSKNITALASATLLNGEFQNIKILKEAENKENSALHFGSRIAQDKNNYIYWTVGERFSARQKAQDLRTHHGKILRLDRDGSVPSDNPFVGKPNALPEIWSYGHRNPQGLVFDFKNNILYENEHGPQGGDEINVIYPGRNYGWPVITYGEEYGGGTIGSTSKKGMEQPIKYYIPSIAPSGMAIYYGDAFPEWNGDLFLGALAGLHLNHVSMKNGIPVAETRYFEGTDRYRAVRVSPKGFIYVSTDSGKIIELSPL